MNTALLDLLREDLLASNYHVDSVRARLGTEVDEARARGVLTPARRVLRGQHPDPLTTLISIFLLGEALDDAVVDAALPRLGVRGALSLGLVTVDNGLAQAALALNPVEIADAQVSLPLHWWIISDLDDALRRGPARPDHVMGVGGATRSLIAQAPPGVVRNALDLGTGCGIVAMHLALRGPVVATDISQRALDFARANARLNQVTGVEFRHGDLYAPVYGERFDLILSNPPFVVTPRDTAHPHYEYRDAGQLGDALAERVVLHAPQHLNDGGTVLCLANWEYPWGGDGLARVTEWITAADQALGAGTSLAAWVIERDRVSPLRYAETWARDGGARAGDPEFDRMLESWLDDFAARRVFSLGLGSIRIRRIDAALEHQTLVHAEHAEGAYSAHAGRDLAAAFESALCVERLSDRAVLDERWLRDPEVIEERTYAPGEEAPSAITLCGRRGVSRRVVADPVLAAAVGACDGDLSLQQIADALAVLLEVDPATAAEALVSGVRELVWFGMLTPSSEPQTID